MKKRVYLQKTEQFHSWKILPEIFYVSASENQKNIFKFKLLQKNIILFKIKKNTFFQKSDLRMNQNDLTLSRVSELFDELEEESRVFISSVERIQ